MENINKIKTQNCIADYEKDNNWHKLIDSLKILKEQKDIVNNYEQLSKNERKNTLSELEVEIDQLEDYINQNKLNSNKKHSETNFNKDEIYSFDDKFEDLIIGEVSKCCVCEMARPQILLINCCSCGDSYCFGFINHWNKTHKQGCDHQNVKYVILGSSRIKEYNFDEIESKAKTFTNPENNTLEYNREFLNYLKNIYKNIYDEILNRIKLNNHLQYELLKI
jgi:hypothetical protein